MENQSTIPTPSDTERIHFRPMCHDDLGNMRLILQDANAMKYYPGIYSDEGITEWIDRRIAGYAKYGLDFWVCEEKETGMFLGQCGLILRPEFYQGRDELELGYLFVPAHWHKGYATEAARQCLNYAFERGYHRVIAMIRPVNTPSIRLAEKLDLKPDYEREFFGFQTVVHAIEKG